MAQYLRYEAQIGHHYGLDDALAIASLTSVPAKALGMGHRVGYARVGYDADIVLWDSHPLALGAAPIQVFIDGIGLFDAKAVEKKVLQKAEIRQAPPQRVYNETEAFNPDVSARNLANRDF